MSLAGVIFIPQEEHQSFSDRRQIRFIIWPFNIRANKSDKADEVDEADGPDITLT